MNAYINKRTLIGPLLFLLLVGEVNVAAANGLLTPVGLFVLPAMYYVYFLLFDAIVATQKLSRTGVVLLNFALYSVLITGLLHGELQNYILNPQDSLITTLIRIQAALYPIFAYEILNKLAPRPLKKSVSISKALLLFVLFFALLSPSKTLGFYTLLETFRIAPNQAIFYTALGIGALFKASKSTKKLSYSSNKLFLICALLLASIATVPGIATFILLLVLMIITGIAFLLKNHFRDQAPF